MIGGSSRIGLGIRVVVRLAAEESPEDDVVPEYLEEGVVVGEEHQGLGQQLVPVGRPGQADVLSHHEATLHYQKHAQNQAGLLEQCLQLEDEGKIIKKHGEWRL